MVKGPDLYCWTMSCAEEVKITCWNVFMNHSSLATVPILRTLVSGVKVWTLSLCSIATFPGILVDCVNFSSLVGGGGGGRGPSL